MRELQRHEQSWRNLTLILTGLLLVSCARNTARLQPGEFCPIYESLGGPIMPDEGDVSRLASDVDILNAGYHCLCVAPAAMECPKEP